jgi:hypothetical protein
MAFHLTEPNMRQLVVDNLNECKQLKLRYYSRVMNLSLLAVFVVVVGGFLYFRYRGRLPPEVKKARQEADRLYILNRLKMVQRA